MTTSREFFHLQAAIVMAECANAAMRAVTAHLREAEQARLTAEREDVPWRDDWKSSAPLGPVGGAGGTTGRGVQAQPQRSPLPAEDFDDSDPGALPGVPGSHLRSVG